MRYKDRNGKERRCFSEKRNCKVCKKEFLCKTFNNIYCSTVCCKSAQEILNSTFYKWRFEILERDGFTCRYCGATPRTDIKVKLHR